MSLLRSTAARSTARTSRSTTKTRLLVPSSSLWGNKPPALRLSILRELIDNEILMRRAEKLGLLATDDEVERKLNEIKSPYTKEEFDARMKEKKLTLDDFKRDLRRSLTVDKVLNKEVTSKINVSDQDITNYYNAHKAEFNLVEPQYHLAQIFVTTSPNPQVHNLKNDKAQNEADARKKIQMLLIVWTAATISGRWRWNYSEDPETSGNGGDLGFTPESSLEEYRPGYSRRRHQVKARPVQPGDHRHQSDDQAVGRLPHCETDRQGKRWATRIVRSPGAGGDPFAATRPARATSEGSVLRSSARSGQSGKLLRGKSIGRQRYREVSTEW